jgi:hypothetical protein
MFYSATKRRGIVRKLMYFGEILHIFFTRIMGTIKTRQKKEYKVVITGTGFLLNHTTFSDIKL